MEAILDRELAARGLGDLRPALLAVGQHIRAGGVRLTELAERTRLTKPTVVHALDELERLGYVRREPDPSDARAKLIFMTERGRQVEQIARETAVEIRAAWAAAMGEEELADLERGLRRLRAALWPEPDSRETA